MRRLIPLVVLCLALFIAGCGKLSRTEAAKQITSDINMQMGATASVTLDIQGDVDGMVCGRYAGHSNWAEHAGLVQKSAKVAHPYLKLTEQGSKLSELRTDEIGPCKYSNAVFTLGKIPASSVDIMEIFADGPRARVTFAYDVKPADPAFSGFLAGAGLKDDPFQTFTVGTFDVHSLAREDNGEFKGFGTANFEHTDNGWSLKKIEMD